MSFKSFKYLFLMALLPLTGMIHAQQSFSVEEAVQYAIKNHSSTKKDIIKLTDAEAQMRAIKATGLPQISGSGEYQYFIEVPEMVLPAEFDPSGEGGTVAFQRKNNLNLGLSASILAFDGTYLVALKAAKFFREFVKSETEITPVTIRKSVTDSYYTVLIAEKNKSQLEKNLSIIQNIRKETAEIFKSGLNEKIDVDRIDLSISNLQSTINNLGRNIEILKNVLKFQMQLPMDQEVVLTDNFDKIYEISKSDNGKSTEQLNINKRPEFRMMGKGIELAQLDIERYQKGFLPSVNVYTSFGRGFQSDNIFKSGGFWIPSSVIGLKLNVPIYDGGGKKANIQRARLTVEKNTIDRSDFERATNLEVVNAQKTYLNALETVVEKQKTLDLAQEIFRVSQVKYKEGIGASFETSQAESELYSAQAALIQAQAEVITSRFAIEKALGNFE